MLKQLIKSIVYTTALALPFWVAIRVLINVSSRKRRERATVGREILLASFFVYLVIVAALTIVPVPMSRFRCPGRNDLNLIPLLNSFKCVPTDATMRRNVLMFCLQNMVGNVLLFLPLGIFLPSVSDKFRSLKRVLAVALVLSSSIEVIQFLSGFARVSFRTVDVDDILLNVAGAGMGFFLLKMAEARPSGRALGR